MTQTARAENTIGVDADRPYLVISSDSHAGPSLERTLRPYCPKKYLDQYDDFVLAVRAGELSGGARDEQLGHVDQFIAKGVFVGSDASESNVAPSAASIRAARTRDCPGHDDPGARLRDMDTEGITSELIFAGGQNGEVMPFIGFASDAGPANVPVELRQIGEDIWNRWLVDFVSIAPERMLGVVQIPIWDITGAVKAIEWACEYEFRAINFPAPWQDYVPYNDPAYEPLWTACEELGTALVTHSGGGDSPLGFKGPGGPQIYIYENLWMSRRHLWEMIFGGVFERHPDLALVFTEQRMWWVSQTLKELDQIALSQRVGRGTGARGTVVAKYTELSRTPSEYWKSNCYNAGSYMAPHEAAMRYDIGLENLLWGSDYPHGEGTWPYTLLSLRNTFAGLPERDTRMILGENALRAYKLDEATLRPIADQIGPRPSQVHQKLYPEEIPEDGGNAFRDFFEIT